MKYLGLDLGTVTCGIAISDRTGIIANSYKTIRYKKENELLEKLDEIIKKENINEIVLGLPKNMNNTIGERAETTIEFSKLLETKFNIKVHLEDERLTTVVAESILLEGDLSRKKRKKVIDSLSASIILQSYLDRRKI